MAFHLRNHFRLGWPGCLIQQSNHTHDHARRTIAALHCPFGKERLLDWMQLVARRKPLDSEDALVFGPPHGGDAGSDAFAADQDRAGSALSFAATVLGAR